MKKLVQNSGVRKWYGDEWITIQDEANTVIEGFFGHYNTPFILSGCEVDGTNIAAGIVGLIHADGFKLCRFAGATGVTFPIYLKPVKTEETRQYLDGATKAVAYIYTAEASTSSAPGCLEIKADGSTPHFRDAFQDANNRFCSDVEKANYAEQASSAIATLRDGISDQINTLEKLRVYLQSLIPEESNIDTVYAYIDGLTYLPTYRGTSVLAGATIDWRGTPEMTKTLTETTQLDASNLIAGKTIRLMVSGAFALTFSSKFKKAVGSFDPSITLTNYVQMVCVNDTPGSEMIIYSVIYVNV